MTVDGTTVASKVFGTGSGAGACSANASVAAIPIGAALMSQIASDGIAEVRIEPSIGATSAGCATATLQVVLDYTRTPVDCDGNGNDDACDLSSGAEDVNANGKLDVCEIRYGDLTLDGVINGADLGALLGMWSVPSPPYGDLNGDGVVGGADLGILLGNWGAVP